MQTKTRATMLCSPAADDRSDPNCSLLFPLSVCNNYHPPPSTCECVSERRASSVCLSALNSSISPPPQSAPSLSPFRRRRCDLGPVFPTGPVRPAHPGETGGGGGGGAALRHSRPMKLRPSPATPDAAAGACRGGCARARSGEGEMKTELHQEEWGQLTSHAGGTGRRARSVHRCQGAFRAQASPVRGAGGQTGSGGNEELAGGYISVHAAAHQTFHVRGAAVRVLGARGDGRSTPSKGKPNHDFMLFILYVTASRERYSWSSET